jgi:peroxiredoxin
MTKLREALAALPVIDGDEQTVLLGQLLGPPATPALLVFVRHFACPSCSSTAHAFAARAAEIAALGARLVIVGNGSPAALSGFLERVGLPPTAAAVTDPSLRAHEVAGMLRSKWATFQPRAALRSIGLYLSGHYAKRRADDGDLDQQGGVLLFGAAGLLFEHRNHFVGDDADPSDVVAALLSESAARAEVRT